MDDVKIRNWFRRVRKVYQQFHLEPYIDEYFQNQIVYFPPTVQTGADLERMDAVWCNDVNTNGR